MARDRGFLIILGIVFVLFLLSKGGSFSTLPPANENLEIEAFFSLDTANNFCQSQISTVPVDMLGNVDTGTEGKVLFLCVRVTNVKMQQQIYMKDVRLTFSGDAAKMCRDVCGIPVNADGWVYVLGDVPTSILLPFEISNFKSGTESILSETIRAEGTNTGAVETTISLQSTARADVMATATWLDSEFKTDGIQQPRVEIKITTSKPIIASEIVFTGFIKGESGIPGVSADVVNIGAVSASKTEIITLEAYPVSCTSALGGQACTRLLYEDPQDLARMYYDFEVSGGQGSVPVEFANSIDVVFALTPGEQGWNPFADFINSIKSLLLMGGAGVIVILVILFLILILLRR